MKQFEKMADDCDKPPSPINYDEKEDEQSDEDEDDYRPMIKGRGRGVFR